MGPILICLPFVQNFLLWFLMFCRWVPAGDFGWFFEFVWMPLFAGEIVEIIILWIFMWIQIPDHHQLIHLIFENDGSFVFIWNWCFRQEFDFICSKIERNKRFVQIVAVWFYDFHLILLEMRTIQPCHQIHGHFVTVIVRMGGQTSTRELNLFGMRKSANVTMQHTFDFIKKFRFRFRRWSQDIFHLENIEKIISFI